MGNMENVDAAVRSAIIKKAAIIGIAGNFCLSALKIFFGANGNSMALIGDGIDSSVDVLIGVMTLFVARVISRPADAEHPWGHGRAETIATALLSAFLVFAACQLILSSGQNIVFHKAREIPSKGALIISIVSIIGKLLLSLNQLSMGRKAKSAILTANAKNMAGDVIISASVFAGILVTIIWKIAIVDSITAILVGLWIIKNAISIFIDANSELMDGGSPKAKYQLLFDAVHKVPGAGRPHRARMRQIAGFWDIDIDIEVDGNLSVRAAHKIASAVEYAIRENLENVYDIMVHVEPDDQSDKEAGDEKYGLSEAQI